MQLTMSGTRGTAKVKLKMHKRGCVPVLLRKVR